jgi:ATP-dependent Lon protease
MEIDLDLSKWVEYFENQKKRKRDNNDDDDDDMNELKLLILTNLKDIIKKVNYKGRQLNKFLTNLQTILKESSNVLKNSDDFNKDTKVIIYTYTFLMNDLISDLKLCLYSNKNFDLESFFISKEKLYSQKLSKVDPIIIVDNFKEEEEGSSSSDDSEYETTDDEEEDLNLLLDNEDNYDKNNMNKLFLQEVENSETNFDDIKDEAMAKFCNLKDDEKKILLKELKNINKKTTENLPMLFKIIKMNTTEANKKQLISKILSLSHSASDNLKLKSWLEDVLKIPFGIYSKVNNNNTKEFLKEMDNLMNIAVWGHNEPKNRILQIMAQKIRNPNSKGQVIAIHGPPGNGKTTLIKEGIAKAMNKPFVFISLGGATDSAFLEGHSFTYEGSIYGRIARGIIESKCMDPIIYFDELDKVSNTPKGEEIINLLVHIIDPAQNEHFRDKYFHGIDIDISRATFIFSFNDLSKINYILLDRITTIETKYLTSNQKLHICENYLLPFIFKDLGFKENSIIFSKDILNDIINTYTKEGGVRKIKSLLYEICQQINLLIYKEEKLLNDKIKLPLKLKQKQVDFLLQNHYKIEKDNIHEVNKVGVVNGLWAGSLGIGGVLPIETTLIPSKSIFSVKATGSLEKVIKESVEVALSVAWNKLNTKTKNKWLEKWNTNPECFHVHCPEGAVPKDGPSAGCALTLALYSRLANKKIRNDIAMTGEINLQEKVMKIGGLEEKISGAKLAGVYNIFIPKDNLVDYEKIKIRNPELLEDMTITPVEKFQLVMEKCLV